MARASVRSFQPPSDSLVDERAAVSAQLPGNERWNHDRLHAVRMRNELRLLGMEGVEGIGEGYDPQLTLIVYCRDLASAQRIPAVVEGVAVRAIVSGSFSSDR